MESTTHQITADEAVSLYRAMLQVERDLTEQRLLSTTDQGALDAVFTRVIRKLAKGQRIGVKQSLDVREQQAGVAANPTLSQSVQPVRPSPIYWLNKASSDRSSAAASLAKV